MSERFSKALALLIGQEEASRELVYKCLENSFVVYKTFSNLIRKMKQGQSKIDSISELSYAVIVFANVFTNKSVIGMATSSASPHISHLKDKMMELIFLSGYGNVEAQSGFEELLNSAEGKWNSFTTFKNSEIYKRFYKFHLYALTYSLYNFLGINFNTLGYSKMEAECIKSSHNNATDFVEVIGNSLFFIARAGHQIITTGECSILFHSQQTYLKWYDSHILLKKKVQYIASPIAYEAEFGEPYVESSFLKELDIVIRQGENMSKYVGRDSKDDARRIKYMVNELHGLRCDIITRLATGEERDVPFCMLIFGESKIGKTNIQYALSRFIAEQMGLPVGKEFVYPVPPNETRWDNFKSSHHTLIMDDIAAIKGGVAQGVDPTLDLVIRISNGHPFMPEQAELKDKGMTPLRSKILLASTNKKDLNASAYFSCPSALQRRFRYVVEPSVKSEYRDRDGFLDFSKVDSAGEGFPDWWDWTVYEALPAKKERMSHLAKMECVFDKVDLRTFLKFVQAEVNNHENMNNNFRNTVSHIMDVNYCEFCKMPPIVCECAKAQAGIEKNALNFGVYTGLVIVGFLVRFLGWDHYHGSYEEDMQDVQLMQEEETSQSFLRRAKSQWDAFNFRELLPDVNIDSWKDGLYSYTDRFIPDIAYYYYWRYSKVRTIFIWLLQILVLYLLLCVFDYFQACLTFMAVRYFFIVFNAEKRAFRLAFQKRYPRYSRQLFGRIGARVETSIGSNNLFRYLAIGGTLTSIILIVRSLMPTQCNEQGGIDSKESVPNTHRDKDNVWYKPEIKLSHLDLSARSLSMKGLSHNDVLSIVGRNCVFFLIGEKIPGRGRQVNKGFCLFGQYYLVNNHAVPSDGNVTFIMTSNCSDEGVSTENTFSVPQTSLFRYPSKDVCIVHLPTCPPKKDLSNLFAKESFTEFGNSVYMSKDKYGNLKYNPVKGARSVMAANITNLGVRADIIELRTGEITKDGDCGSILLAVTPLGPAIVGMHFGALPNKTALAMKITNEWIKEVLTDIGAIKIQSGYARLSSESAPRQLRPLDKKSVFRYIESGTATIFGSYSGFRMQPRSKVSETPMNAYLTERGYPTLYTAPMMNGWKPWRHAAVELVHPIRLLNPEIIQKCKFAFLDDILASNLDLSVLGILSDDEALNGIPGMLAINALPRNTSAGNPFKCSKRKFLVPHKDEEDKVDFTPEIWNRIRDIEIHYKKLELTHPVFCAHLKDEAVSLEKAKSGKTRVFTGAPVDYSMVVRKYLLTFCRLVQLNPFVFESGPGTICQSQEWGDIYNYLVQYGENRIVAGDYSKFDKRMSPAVILAAYEIIYELCKRSGCYTEEELNVIWCIAYDTAFPYVDFNGDLVQFHGSNPSGHPLTVIINGLVNCIYMRYVYYDLNPLKDVKDFKKYVSLFTYGDDNIMGVSPRLTWFNHTTISNQFMKYDIKYTMADKNEASVPFINIRDATFLKRKWRWDDDLNAWAAPLEEDSIIKSLMIWVRSSIWSGEQAISIISSAQREYFFYGRRIYYNRMALLKQMCNELPCTNCNPLLGEHNLCAHITDSTFPSWDELYDAFHQRNSVEKESLSITNLKEEEYEYSPSDEQAIFDIDLELLGMTQDELNEILSQDQH